MSADAGYWSEDAVEQVEDYWIEALVAPKKIRHREWLETPIEEHPPPEGLSVRDRMAWVLITEWGRTEYGKRKITAEPVFGQMKGAMGFREFLLRGHRKVRGEWKLATAAHNVLKLFRAGVDPRALAGLRLGSEAG